jgi:hypothetical protein
MSFFLSRFALLSIALAPAATAATYSATPANAPTAARIIARDISWSCDQGGCRGVTSESRPLVLCQALAKKAGQLVSFTVDGRDLAADQLAKCNSAAPTAKTSAIARN